MAFRPPSKYGKKRLADGLNAAAKAKAGGLPGPPTKNTKVGRSVLNDQMPGNQASRPAGKQNFGMEITKADSGIQWGRTFTNTSGNSRNGMKGQVGIDQKTGQVYHRYAKTAADPAAVVGVKQTPEAKAAFKAEHPVKQKPRKTFGQRLASRTR